VRSNDFNSVYTYIEIPRSRLAKFELSKKDAFHPIMQDTRKNKFDKSRTELRYYAQFPLFNYGLLPQTWENDIEKTSEGYLVSIFSLNIILYIGRWRPS
jgi:inorganic pyrophosphatase